MRSSLESLQDVALRQVISNATHPSPDGQSRLSKETSEKVCLRLPLPESGACLGSLTHVDNENYWKRASGSDTAATHHKRLFLEDNLALLNLFGRDDKEESSAADVVHGLYLTSPAEEIDFAQLRNLTAVRLSKASHMVKAQLSDALAQTRHQIVSLAIAESNLLDQDLRLILTGLGDAASLLHLDLSNSSITCGDGFKELVSSLLMPENALLTYLDLSGNKLDQNAGIILGNALECNKSLLTLNLRLNSLKDCGGSALFAGLRENVSLELINVSANGLGSRVVKDLSILEQDKARSSFKPTIVLTSNPFLSQDMDILRSFRALKIDTRSKGEGVL